MSRGAEIVAVTATYDLIKIHFGEVLHLLIKKPDIVGVQAWRHGDQNFSIEYTMKDGVAILCEYDQKDVWQKILAGIEAAL